MRYRLYLDESGDHTSSNSEDIGKRYLGLIGVAFLDPDYIEFAEALERFKREHLEYDIDEPPVMHREDIVNRRGCFSVLYDEDKRARFDDGLLVLLREAKCRVIAVVIDKAEHGKAKYRMLTHPYHYCLHAMLERYCGYLDRFSPCQGDVLAEVRGKAEDLALKNAYEMVWNKGTRYMTSAVAKKTLTSKQIKLKPKHANVAGLQLADILAHPLTRDVLTAYGRIPRIEGAFSAIVGETIKAKYNCHAYTQRTKGYGQVILA